MLAVRLPKEIETRLGSLASMTGRTKTYYVKRAISELLEDMEDTFLAIEALSEKDMPIPHEQVVAEFELKQQKMNNER